MQNKIKESPYVKVKKQVSKIKFFGSENNFADISISQAQESSKSENNEEYVEKEEITENLLKYDQFFSD